MGMVDDVLKAFDRIPGWKRLQEVPSEVDELKSRVAALEAALARCPGEACPFCGARAWRVKEVEMLGECEIWHCQECQKEREYRYDLAGQLPPAQSRIETYQKDDASAVARPTAGAKGGARRRRDKTNKGRPQGRPFDLCRWVSCLRVDIINQPLNARFKFGTCVFGTVTPNIDGDGRLCKVTGNFAYQPQSICVIRKHVEKYIQPKRRNARHLGGERIASGIA